METNIQEIAREMLYMVKHKKWDLKDLLCYYEQGNGIPYKKRVEFCETNPIPCVEDMNLEYIESILQFINK